MTLGDWIDTLSALPPDAEVVMDCGTVPDRLGSWRGAYEELTLENDTKRDPHTVKELLYDALQAVGKTFTGYKGGHYVMDRSTPVWADDYGDYERRMLLGAKLSGGRVVLQTMVKPAEYSY